MKYPGDLEGSFAAPGLRRAGCSVVGMFLVLLQLGSGTPLQKSLDQIQRSVTRPVPQAPPPVVTRPGDVWVPDRVVSDPVDGRLVHIPGHWERRLPSGELYGPPTTRCDSTGNCATIPAGPRPSADPRQNP